MDNELFELCKEVWKVLPDWVTGEWIDYYQGKFTIYKASHNEFGDYQCPLYTSDYLLEKLGELFYITIENHGFGKTSYWEASHISDDDNGSRQSDTPLKALLKLTLALHAAGELK